MCSKLLQFKVMCSKGTLSTTLPKYFPRKLHAFLITSILLTIKCYFILFFTSLKTHALEYPIMKLLASQMSSVFPTGVNLKFLLPLFLFSLLFYAIDLLIFFLAIGSTESVKKLFF